ncbi:hypothetical protein AVEN_206752-1 [Araneus ventricosus]|uniref:Integrase catalytic domain-containing protein n=1 Tax=Araneus ventricosus TaxID=182803 RepID=A0A4Y2C6E6_ARAVE|nr:hypothetical protein AVEN_206752-1 [Araneus ventricosus]
MRKIPFHPAANGIVERMHRQLKACSKCYATLNWSEGLPTVLLGIRARLKGDIGVSVYGQCLCLSGEFKNYTSPKQGFTKETFWPRLRLYIRKLWRPACPSHHSPTDVFVHPDLRT